MDHSHNMAPSAIQRVSARSAEIGGSIRVSRLLPTRERRMVGAWCFLDHAGPAVFKPGELGLHVGPHPHIGLQTFTWMIQGEVLHRDSLGNQQVIRPGQVNLMTAGLGISHTEESMPGGPHLHAVQLWIALPESERERAPAFEHYADLPRWQQQGLEFTLLAGEYAAQQAPTGVYSSLLGLDLFCATDTALQLPLRADFEHGLLVVEGEWTLNGEPFSENQLAFIERGATQLDIQASQGARAVLLGGEPYPTELLVWWNFVGHSKQEIIQAQLDWEAKHARFGEVQGFDGPRLTAPPLPWKA